jgi:hypothetical protein
MGEGARVEILAGWFCIVIELVLWLWLGC